MIPTQHVLSRGELRAILVMLALGQVLLQGGLLLRGTNAVVSSLTIDDTYYYLQSAWNTARLGFVTFDGVHSTNGVQFLWFWLLVPLAKLSPTKIGFLYTVLSLCIFLNALAYLAIERIGSLVGRTLLPAALGVFWFNLNVLGHRWSMTGMESSLHAFLLWILFASALGLLGPSTTRGSRAFLAFTLLLVLNVWTRLDAVLLTLLLFGGVVYSKRASLSLRVQWAALLLAISGAGLMFSGFYWMGGSFLPVSGLVKTQQYRWDGSLFLGLLARGFERPTNVSAVASRLMGGRFEGILGTQWSLALAVIAVILVCLLFRTGAYPKALRSVWGIYGVAALLHAGLLAGMGTYASYGVWYQSPYYIFAVMTLGITFDGGLMEATKRGWLAGRHARAVGIGLLILAISPLGYWVHRRVNEPEDHNSLMRRRLVAAEWIRKHIDKDAVLASSNAGMLGYFCDRQVINLDGLNNNYDFYRNVILEHGSLTEYLRGEKVTHFVDYQVPGDIREISRSLHEVGGGDEDRISILALLPEPSKSKFMAPDDSRPTSGVDSSQMDQP